VLGEELVDESESVSVQELAPASNSDVRSESHMDLVYILDVGLENILFKPF
jgi:hypothetical protein